MKEPLWRTVLCWGAVTTFFTFPLSVFALRIFSIEYHWEISERWPEFHGVGTFYQTIAALVFGLAGLRSFDRAWEMRNGQNRIVKPEEAKKEQA